MFYENGINFEINMNIIKKEKRKILDFLQEYCLLNKNNLIYL